VPLDRRVWLEAEALRDNGYRVTVIGPRGSGNMRRFVERRAGIRILRYPQRAATGLAGYLVEYLPSLIFTMAWLLAVRIRGPVHVVHGCNPPDLFFLAGRLARTWGARYVFDQHDANPELAMTKWPGSGPRVLLVRLTRWLERASYRTAALVLVPNDSYAALAAERGEVDPERIEVVRNAPGGPRQPAPPYGPPNRGQLRLGYLGVMGSQDGVEILIDAVAELRELDPDLDVQVDLVGDGAVRTKLERRASKRGVGDRCHFHGYLAAAAYRPILERAHICVSPDPPTPFNDVSTMTKVVDYLAMGRPVVAFDLAETRLLMGDGGVVARPSARELALTLLDLSGQPDRLSAMSGAAARRLDELEISWDRSKEALLRGYAKLVPTPQASEVAG
jgi:glycosyltransferase involved in cell wall biosynthesis